ncbi:MAG: type III pantothenate kinase [Chlorobiaceae bacterium]
MFFSGESTDSEPLLLAIEIGNTNTSFAVFKGDKSLEALKVMSKTFFVYEDIAELVKPILQRYPVLCDAVLCSVIPSVDSLVTTCLRRLLSGNIVEVSTSLHLPFTLHYKSSDKFGADRIALCALSRRLYPDDAVIALDVGTAITIDILSSGKGMYLGGLIMPGLDLMALSLHEHTARLPLAGIDLPETLIGNSTVECIRNGIVWGCVSSIEGLILKIKTWLLKEHDEKNIRVIITGGSAPLVASLLTSAPLLEELAVLRGTCYLFQLNAQEQRNLNNPY